MDKFEIPIDLNKFKKTNSPWNQLMLNDPWSVGYVSMLIELKAFDKKEDWQQFYYEMGEYRVKRLKEQPEDIIEILENEELIRTDKNQVYNLSNEVKSINRLNGRTEKQLEHKGEILHKFIQEKYNHISLHECIEAVKYRVIGETWNGIILREHKTIENLITQFSEVKFEKTTGQFDFQYAVDYKILKADKLLCGIQIKPKSYTYDTPYLKKAQRANQAKNLKYTQEYQVPVFDVISTIKGEVLNEEVMEKISKLM